MMFFGRESGSRSAEWCEDYKAGRGDIPPEAEPHGGTSLAKPRWFIVTLGEEMKSAFTLLGLLLCSVTVLLAEDTRLSPKKEDLIGIWVPDKESMREFENRAKNRASPEIELRVRGGFAVVNIPSWWRNDLGRPAGRFWGIDGGEWALKKGKDGPELLLEHRAFGFSMVLSIEGHKPPYFILLHVGGTSDNAPVRFYRRSGELNPPNQSPQPTRLTGG